MNIQTARQAAAEQVLLRENIGPIVVLTLNRPAARNSLSEAMMAELQASLDAAAADATVRVIVLAALPLFALRSPFTTTPEDGTVPPLSQLGAATVVQGEPLVGADDPAWVTPDPLVSGEDRPDADVDRCQVDVAATIEVNFRLL